MLKFVQGRYNINYLNCIENESNCNTIAKM